jgi:hypothetical protein
MSRAEMGSGVVENYAGTRSRKQQREAGQDFQKSREI